ncbi:MAG: hypothetical protein ACXAC7_02180 [Candidatus Hodarchaeales archaeon]
MNRDENNSLDIKLFVTKLSDLGPDTVALAIDGLFDDEMEKDTFLIRYGAYFLSILGQSSERFTGLFGPLPVHGLYDLLSYLFAFEVDDPTLEDVRLDKRAYCIMAMFFKKSENESMNFLRNYVEAALWKFVKNIENITQIDESFLDGIKDVIQIVYERTSIDRTDTKVIIRKRVEDAVTKSEVKINLNNLRDKRKWVIISDPATGDFPVTVESILSLLADQIKKYERKGSIQLAQGKIQAILLPANEINKRKKEISNSDGLIFTFNATTKGIKPENPNIPYLRESLSVLSNDEKNKNKVAIAIEGELETSAAFEISVASISSSVDSQLLFAQPISFFPIHRDFPEKTLEMINFLLKRE